MDIKTLSAMIGQIRSETTLNIYSHIAGTMQRQTHIQECIRKDTRGMRGKARVADKANEKRNRRDKKEGECVTYKG